MQKIDLQSAIVCEESAFCCLEISGKQIINSSVKSPKEIDTAVELYVVCCITRIKGRKERAWRNLHGV
jgi:hypothetical protein